MPETKFYTEEEEIEVIEEIINQILLTKDEEKNEKNIINRVSALVFLYNFKIEEIKNDEKIKHYNYQIFTKLAKLYKINDPKKNEIFNKKSEKLKFSYINEIEIEIKNIIKIKKEEKEEAKKTKIIKENKEIFNEKTKKLNEKYKNDDLIAL